MSTKLFFVTCLILCLKTVEQTVINPSNLNEYGQNVCSRYTTQTEAYYAAAARTTYTYTTTSCGWFGWGRCGSSRPRTVYYVVQRTRNVNVKIIYCCSGWRKRYSSSRECREAICSQGCDTSHGSCVAPNTCQCSAGWTGNTCGTDDNECASSNGGCDQICVNTAGSYKCSCRLGYTQHGHTCRDIDECQTLIPRPCTCGVLGEPCGATCTNSVPGFVCSCASGFQLRSGGTICDDINECLTANGGCQQRCHNNPGKFSCGCYNGYRTSGSNDAHCEDVDECLSNNGDCTQTCVNTAGSYRCECSPGFFLDSNGRSCSDHDECLLSNHGCQQKCNNYLGSYYCSCNNGYLLNRDNKTCSDVDECTPVYVKSLNTTVTPAGCDQVCHNTPGNYTCSCDNGFQLLYDGKRCRDINECNTGAYSCEHKCHNTPGSYVCSCFHGYRLRADMRTCKGLPCEGIVAPPHGRMDCTGLVTNETCWFKCEDGYELQGSEKRTCLNSSKWDGQQTSCRVKSCGRLHPPEKVQVLLPCHAAFGSKCTLDCMDGYIAFGNNIAKCRLTNSSDVAWDIGNFTCEEIILCKPNPCRHGGRCIVINSQKFSCDCQHTGYEGDLCDRGIVTPPDFPKLISGKPSENLLLLAKPDNSLTVHFSASMNMTFQPKKLTIQPPSSKAEFHVTGHGSGVGMVSYELGGVDRRSFLSPKNSSIFIGHNISNEDSIYTKLSLLNGELPIGCQKKNLHNYPCGVKIAFESTSTTSNDNLIEFGPVHILTSDNRTIPLSLVGYDFSLLDHAHVESEILKKLITQTSITNTNQGDNHPVNERCPYKLTAEALIEFIQEDAFPKSFMQHLTDQLPLWLRLIGKDESTLFVAENIQADLIQVTSSQYIHPNCKFPPPGTPTGMVIYRPIVSYSISVENKQIPLSSKGCCFATDVCSNGVFLTLSERASKELNKMPFMRDMTDGDWELVFSSFGFTTPNKYRSVTKFIPADTMAEDFADFHYNMWWEGTANIILKNSSDFKLNMKMSGQVFSFVEDLNSLFTSYLSQPIKSIFHGSVEFTFSVQALGERVSLTFHASLVVGKTKLGGKPLFSSECHVTQGSVFTLDRSSEPFKNTILSNVVQSKEGSKYLQVYHSVTGGEDISASDPTNNLRFLEWQTQDIRRVLLDVRISVPELQATTQTWTTLVDEMLINVIKARRALSSSSDFLQLKTLVAKIDNALYKLPRVFDLLIAKLHPYRNRTSIENAIDRFIRLKLDLPRTISLVFTQATIQQTFVGVRFALVANICHKRLCFTDMNCNIRSLTDTYCLTDPSGGDNSVIVEGTALRDISLGNVITLPARRPLRVLISRKNEPLVTTFESIAHLLGLTKKTTIRMVGHELFFTTSGTIFGKFVALLNVKADFDNVVNWDSLLFKVEGTMNKSSSLHTMLDKMIANETALAAREATRRLQKAKAAFDRAKMKADAANKVLQRKQAAAYQLRIEREKAAGELRVARLQYQLAKVHFNNTVYFHQHILNSVCEIKQCNYTCLDGCVHPHLCQDPINITYLERYCDTVDKPITIKVVESSTKKQSFSVPTFLTVYTGNCRSGVSFKTIMKYAKGGAQIGKFVGGIIGGAFGGVGRVVGKVVGGLAGGVIGGVVGHFSKKIFGCSNTYETVPGEPRLVEYDRKSFEVKAVVKIIKEVKCTGHEEKTKPGGYGPPYPCCKRYGCQTKVIDPLCVAHNEECLASMTELKFTLDAMNPTFQAAYLTLKESVDKVKKATVVYEKTRIRHEVALSVLQQVKSHTEQSLSAVEIVNASMLHVRRMVDFGLKIAQAMNATDSDDKKIVDVGDMKFSLSVVSEDTRKILFQSNVSSTNGQSTSVSFLVDFDQIERSINSASKTIINRLFGENYSRRKRSAPGGDRHSGNSTDTHSVHTSFTDYPYACKFANATNLYLSSIFRSLGSLISSFKGLDETFSSGFQDLDRLVQRVNASSFTSNASSTSSNRSHPNSSFVTDYLEMIEVLKNESNRLTNDSSQSWNDTFEAWRAFLEVFTHNNEFQECSGTDDCIEYSFEGLKEFYEFENSPQALQIKGALPKLKEMVTSLISDALTMLETETLLRQAVALLNKSQDDSVLCGGTPCITSSPQKEIIVLSGDSLRLVCTAESEEGLKYAWMRNDKIIDESMDGIYYVPTIGKQHEGTYVCVVSNNKGSSSSNVTIVKVHDKPRITLHPRPQRVVVGSEMPATFICNATGRPAATFQWFFQSTNSSAVKINEIKPVLHMSRPRQDHEGYYYCEASNEHGVAVSQKARLDVLGSSIGLPRLLFALNLSSPCSRPSNASNSSMQDSQSCDNNSVGEIPSSANENLTDNIIHSLARSLNVSIKVISELEYGSTNNYTATIVFILDIDKRSWKQNNLTRYVEIVEALADVRDNLIEKVKQFNSSILNKTFEIPWNNTVLRGEPGSLLVYPLSPKCPDGQALSENGYICANCPAGLFYSEENETCVECTFGSYQPVQGQTRCFPCGTNLTTAFNGTVEESDCIADCPAGSYSTKNRTCSVCPLGAYQPSRGQPACIPCGQMFTTISKGTVEEKHCIANCPAGSHSTVNRTCALCPLGTYQPSDGQKDCLPCGQSYTTTSLGAVKESQCREIPTPVTEDEIAITTPVATSQKIDVETSVKAQPTTKSAGEAEGQEKAEQLSWKLPVIIVVPLLVILIVALVLMICFCKKRRQMANASKTSIKSTSTNQFDNRAYEDSPTKPIELIGNPTYGVGQPQPKKCAESNYYSMLDEPGPAACSEDKQDPPEQVYEYIDERKNKSVVDAFADQPIYENLERSFGGKTSGGFENPALK